MFKIVLKICLLLLCILKFSLTLSEQHDNFFHDGIKENKPLNNNSSLNYTESFSDPASMALWLILILILIPILMVFMVFYICCKFICNWGRPTYYHHHEYARPIIIQPQPSTQNFNA
jgi:hypothetical protein